MKNFSNLDLKKIQALVIDMDGVLWRGDTLLPGMQQFFQFMSDRSLPFILATNNASKTPDQYLQKFVGFGVTIDRERILTSSLATATYLQQELKNGAKVYVVGQDGLREALRKAGYTIVPDSSEPADAVVAGIDFALTYDTLKHAVLHIQRGARFIGTNGDLTFPIEHGFAPGAGAILAAIEAATDVSPTVIGKPGRFMFDLAVQSMGTTPAQTAMLGDRLETDILGGQQAGLKTIMVLTGVDNENSMAQKNIRPDVVFAGVDELAQYWSQL